MWLMLQQDEPDDYVLATGVTTSVRQIVEWAFADAGNSIEWRGEGAEEAAYCLRTGARHVARPARYLRPTEVDLLIGVPTKAREKLGWQATMGIRAMTAEMVEADRAALANDG